jgi:hypothetical protein
LNLNNIETPEVNGGQDDYDPRNFVIVTLSFLDGNIELTELEKKIVWQPLKRKPNLNVAENKFGERNDLSAIKTSTLPLQVDETIIKKMRKPSRTLVVPSTVPSKQQAPPPPVSKQAIPVSKQATPAPKQTIPVSKQATPAPKQTIPVSKQTTPAQKQVDALFRQDSDPSIRKVKAYWNSFNSGLNQQGNRTPQTPNQNEATTKKAPVQGPIQAARPASQFIPGAAKLSEEVGQNMNLVLNQLRNSTQMRKSELDVSLQHQIQLNQEVAATRAPSRPPVVTNQPMNKPQPAKPAKPIENRNVINQKTPRPVAKNVAAAPARQQPAVNAQHTNNLVKTAVQNLTVNMTTTRTIKPYHVIPIVHEPPLPPPRAPEETILENLTRHRNPAYEPYFDATGLINERSVREGEIFDVYKCKLATGKSVALKIPSFPITPEKKRICHHTLNNEIFVLKALSNKWIQNFVGTFVIHSNQIGILLEWVNGCDLHQFYRDCRAEFYNKTTMLDVIELLKQVSIGMKHVHTHGFLHRDLKTPNILVSPARTMSYIRPVRWIIKICDFGMADYKENVKDASCHNEDDFIGTYQW